MSKRDYYEVLGVQKKATGDEIKKSFRNKARALHPDNKESGDEAAFKELAEAYEVLSDEQKRSTYDRYGHEGVKGSTRGFDNFDFSSFSGFGIDELIEALFGGGMRGGMGGFGRSGSSGPYQGAHLKYDMEIDFLESVFGVERKVSVKRLEDCTTCLGSGAAPGSTTTTCTTCGGMGQVKQMVNMLFVQSYQIIACPDCGGNGKKIEKPCRDCQGQGLTRKKRDFDVKVPAGIEAGSRLRLTSAGDKGPRGGPYGDLFVIIHVKEHPVFVRDGDIIHIKQFISMSLAALGGEILVPTVDNDKVLKIPAGIQTGTTLVMRELGVPRFNQPNRRGDQLVHIFVETPTKLSSEEKHLLEKLAELRGEKLSVEKKDKKTSDDSRKSSDEQEGTSGSSETSTNHKSSKKKKDKADDDEGSILDKIVDAFRPRNGE